jgi:hypothetical protein
MADAGCWAFILGAFVIHPPNETQLQAESVFVAGLWVQLLLLEHTMQDSTRIRCLEARHPLYYSNKAAEQRPDA